MFQQQQPSEPQSGQSDQQHPQGQQWQQGQPRADQPRDQFTGKFQQIATKERQLRELEAQLKDRSSKVELLEKAFQRANDDPFALLQELNLDIERLYEVKKGGGKFAPGEMQVRQLKTEVERLKEQIAAKEKAEQEAAERRQSEEALANFRNNVAQSLQSSEKHELARTRGGVDDVLDVIAKHYAETSEMLSVDQALDMVEQRYEEDIKKLLGVSKVRQWMSEPQQSSADSNRYERGSADSSGSQVRTLTNSMTARTAPVPQEMTPEQRWQRALSIMERGRV